MGRILVRTRPPLTGPTDAQASGIASLIHTVRGERIILDADLARLYGVPTKALRQAVRRNQSKFPSDFLFEISLVEAEALRRSRSQIVTLKRGENIKYRPFAFTEHGALMAASVLRSPAAVEMSVFIIRAFVRMRNAMTDTRELAHKLAALEKDLTGRLDLHETAIEDFMSRLLQLLEPPPPPTPTPPDKELGFHTTLAPSQTEPNK